MNFNPHYELKDKHAFLAPSAAAYWLKYDDDRLVEVYKNSKAKEIGTRKHEFAAEAIRLGEKLQGKKTIAKYVNDAIGFRMTPEQPLYYSENCFGTADAICFRNKMLRIHDLKTGVTPAKMDQLAAYAALFCLEYGYDPESIKTELRIYQNDEVIIDIPEPDSIRYIMNDIVRKSLILDDYKEAGMI